VTIYEGKTHLLRRRRTIEELIKSEENPFG